MAVRVERLRGEFETSVEDIKKERRSGKRNGERFRV